MVKIQVRVNLEPSYSIFEALGIPILEVQAPFISISATPALQRPNEKKIFPCKQCYNMIHFIFI